MYRIYKSLPDHVTGPVQIHKENYGAQQQGRPLTVYDITLENLLLKNKFRKYYIILKKQRVG